MSQHHQNHIIQPPSSSSYDESLNRFQTHHHQHMITDAEKIDINPSGRSWNKEDKNDHQKKTLLSSCPSTGKKTLVVRVCADCHTTKTPLWRTGPTGPKSLCNACGIRQRKARENKVHKKPKLGVEKSCGSRKKIVLEDLAIRLSNNLSDQQVLFAQDDKEAAILLMALSYGTGLVRG